MQRFLQSYLNQVPFKMGDAMEVDTERSLKRKADVPIDGPRKPQVNCLLDTVLDIV